MLSVGYSDNNLPFFCRFSPFLCQSYCVPLRKEKKALKLQPHTQLDKCRNLQSDLKKRKKKSHIIIHIIWSNLTIKKKNPPGERGRNSNCLIPLSLTLKLWSWSNGVFQFKLVQQTWHINVHPHKQSTFSDLLQTLRLFCSSTLQLYEYFKPIIQRTKKVLKPDHRKWFLVEHIRMGVAHQLKALHLS